jgi:iron complex outermembrane receptor protein
MARNQYLRILIVCSTIFTFPGLAISQEHKQAETELEEIVVSGTRLRADGFEAPTPVTIVPIDSLLGSNPTNIVDAIQELPQFMGSQNFDSGSKAGIGTGRGQFLNLRNLGSDRTLILLDGIRMPPTTYTSEVNSEVIPQMLLERVDVVTSGASAAYGSDAVAGAVNYIIDHDFTGMKVDTSMGISSEGDSFDYRVGIAGGFEVGDRGHFLFSVERFETNGIEMKDRGKQGTISYIGAGSTPGGGPQGTAGNPYIIWEDARWQILSAGGHVGFGPLAGTFFPSAGESRPFDAGTRTGSGLSVIGGDGVALQIEQSISEDANSNQAFMRYSYEGENISAYVMGLYSVAEVGITGGFNYFDFGHQIFSGNPFLPAEVQAQMTEQGAGVIFVNKYVTDSPISPGRDDTDHYSIMAGLEGEFSDKYSWKVDVAYGDTKQVAEEINTPELRKFHAAVDAVVDPATGNTVCRVDITDPGLYPGCVPFNILGELAATPDAVGYIHGNSRYDTKTTLNQISASILGDLFELPAGPLSFIFGLEYRKQKFSMTSNSDPSVVRPVPGLRSLAESAPRWWFANRPSATATLSVKEIFAEFNLPVLKDVTLVKSFDLNGAVRRTNYSTSGSVTTWKAGGTWRPIEDILFRVTRSRDIRAPSLFDLSSSGAAGRSTLNDPQTNVGAVVLTEGGGNPDLIPESADSWSIGAVFRPTAAPGFGLSIDYFDIKLEQAISSLSVQNVVNQCFFSGNSDPICGQIDRPISPTDTSPGNFPTLIRSGPNNSSFIDTKGFDIEASYNTEIGNGGFTSRLFVTIIDEYKTQASPFLPINEQAGTDLVPDLKLRFQAKYTTGPWSMLLQERMIGKITLGNKPNRIWAESDVSAQYYTDITGAYTWNRKDTSVKFFLTIRNLFDNKPPLVPGTAAPRYNFPTLSYYDIIGRTFTLGARANF